MKEQEVKATIPLMDIKNVECMAIAPPSAWLVLLVKEQEVISTLKSYMEIAPPPNWL